MADYVLVHGGFSGGWYWREVAADLPRAGQQVFTPTVTAPLAVTTPAAAALARTFIHCTRKPDDWLAGLGPHLDVRIAEAAERARAAGWRYRELPTDHAPMLSRPHELASLLLELAA